MFKKVLYAGAIFCAVAAMTACGNKKAEEQTPATAAYVDAHFVERTISGCLIPLSAEGGRD